jgi:hypothetical protein
MTPEERRARAEYVVKMAEQGLLAEPAYDREAWRQEYEAEVAPPASRPSSGRRKPNWHLKHPATETSQDDAGATRETTKRRKPASRRSA